MLPSYHPHHEVGENGDPQGGGHKGDHEPAVPAWPNAVRHSAEEQQAQRPGDHPLHPRAAAAWDTSGKHGRFGSFQQLTTDTQ